MIRNYPLNSPTPFVGRTKELAEIVDRLENPECRLLTLKGLGGSGKTRLAVEAAKKVAAYFPHGTVFVGLQPLTKSDLLVTAIAQAVGLTFYGEGEPETQLYNFLREKSLLMLLDNFEHLLDGAALVSAILIHAPKVKILVTCREALNLQEEWSYPLKGMPIPLSTYASSLEEYEAVQLFLYHARRVQPNFNLRTEHEPVIRICNMTAGLPLAIELAASWLKGSSTSQIADEMQCNLDFLSTTMRNIEERHRSMRAVFDQSWRLLSENERLIFARLCAFNGSFDAEAAEQVAEASFSDLAVLVEKSLVQMASSERFVIHEMLDQYGVEKLDEYGEQEATYARLSHYFSQRMLQHEKALQQPEQSETMQALESDFENFRQAWDWSVKNKNTTNLRAMLNGLYLFGFLGSRHREIITIFQNTLDQSLSDTLLVGRLLTRRWGYLHWVSQTNYQDALTGSEQALKISVAENNPFETALAHLMAGYALIGMELYTDAVTHLENSKSLFEALHEPYYVCWALHRLGYSYYNLKNHAQANNYTEQSLALARASHNRVALYICLYNLGSVFVLSGDYLKGKQYGAEALQVASQLGSQTQIAHALSLLALCAFCQGDYALCQDYAQRSHLITEAFNQLIIQPYSLSLLIILACLREDYAEGVRLSESGKQHTTYTMGAQLFSWSLAALACGLGNTTEARFYIQKIFQSTDPNVVPAIIFWMLPSVVYTLVETHPAKAVELLSWIFAFPNSALQWVRLWPLFDRLQTQLQAGMDEESYALHWEKGQTLTFASIKTTMQQVFSASPDADEALSQQLLTARENEILALMSSGMTNPQIAEELVIGAGTVKTHTLNIYRKLDVANRTQAIVRAQELGLLPA